MEHPFERATAWPRVGEGRYAARFEEGWYQGRGVYGGAVAAGMLRCLMDTVGPTPPRTFTVNFCSPATVGEAECVTTVERPGRLVTHASARLVRGDEVLAFAAATFADDRAGGYSFQQAPAPVAPPADQVPSFRPSAMTPAFLHSCDLRFCVGHLPFAQVEEAWLGGWCQLRPARALDAPVAAALLDAWPPAVLTRLDTLVPCVTTDITYHFLAPLPPTGLDPCAHVLVSARSEWAEGGYIETQARMWSADGRLLASARQVFAMLRDPGAPRG